MINNAFLDSADTWIKTSHPNVTDLLRYLMPKVGCDCAQMISFELSLYPRAHVYYELSDINDVNVKWSIHIFVTIASQIGKQIQLRYDCLEKRCHVDNALS
jgi:hypothetical protein